MPPAGGQWVSSVRRVCARELENFSFFVFSFLMAASHWQRRSRSREAAALIMALHILAPRTAAGHAASCGRIGWNAVAVLLTSPCNAAAGHLAVRGRWVRGGAVKHE
jgi:hypothetical protein